MMALAGIELETLVSEPAALTTRPPTCPALVYYRSTCIIDDAALSFLILIVQFVNVVRFEKYIVYAKYFYLWYLVKYQIKHIFLF